MPDDQPVSGEGGLPDNWLTREFARARARIESLPVWARPVRVRPAHTHEWEVEYLPDPTSAGGVVRSGDLACRCGATVEDRPLGGDAPTRAPGPDMRVPGEAYCADCPDREACFTGYPCDVVRRALATPPASGQPAAEPTDPRRTR